MSSTRAGTPWPRRTYPCSPSIFTTPLYGDTPFRCEVFYVSKRTFTDLKWGTVEPILFRDSEFKMIRLRSNGIYTFQITDPKLFVVKLVGTRGIYTNAQIEDFLRGVIIGRLADILGESLDSVLDLPRYFDELGAGLKARIRDDFAQYGLAIVDFLVNAISPPEDVQKRIDERSGMEAVGGMDRYFQYKAAQAIGDLAKGGGGSGGGGGTDIGSAATAGLGLGAGAGLGMMIPGMLQQAMAGGAQPKVRCPNCSQDIPYGSKFCPNCGANLAATVTCPKCKATLPAGSKFCPNCGQNLTAPAAAPAEPRARCSKPRRPMRLPRATSNEPSASPLGLRAPGRLPAPCWRCVAGPTASAAAKDWRIDNMDVLLDVQENGDVIVDEMVTFTFEGNYHFVARDIPTENTGGITDIEVRDANGTPLPKGDSPGTYSTFKEGDTLYIQMNFDLTDTSSTWTIHYRAKNVVMFCDEGDELRWYVFDADTPVPIGAVKATVKLPGSVPSERHDSGRPGRIWRGDERHLAGRLHHGVSGLRHPSVHQLLDRDRVPQGRGQVHVDGAASGGIPDTQDRVPSPHSLLPRHALDLAPAWAR